MNSLLFGIGIGIGIGLVTLVLVAILVRQSRRTGHVDGNSVLEAVEGMRQQNSAEHMAFQAEQSGQGRSLGKLLDRFGFLKRVK